MQVTQQHPTGRSADEIVSEIRKGIATSRGSAVSGRASCADRQDALLVSFWDGYIKACDDITRFAVDKAVNGEPVFERQR